MTAIKKILKTLLILLLIIVLAAAGYAAYIFTSYYRLDDNIMLDVEGSAAKDVLKVSPGKKYHITSWNIGFAAYTDQFSFFMDGGKYSRAFSEDATLENMDDIIEQLSSFESDIYLIQEVDFDSTRTYHIDEKDMICDSFYTSFDYTFGQNYDSPYLFYPVTSPIGASRSGLLTMSCAKINESVRRSLPIQTGPAKFLDLDRAYTVNRVACSNGKDLVLINLHLSAYTTDDTIVKQQLEVLFGTIKEEYAKGNYVIAGGDFNMDLLEDSGSIFGVSGKNYSWAQPFPTDTIPDGVELVVPFNSADPKPTCRNADSPWDPETNFQISIDGFLITDNVKLESCEVTDLEFAYSDHEPIQLVFSLKN